MGSFLIDKLEIEKGEGAIFEIFQNEEIFNYTVDNKYYSDEFRELFFGENITSISAIVGKNGAGKSLLLKEIAGQFKSKENIEVLLFDNDKLNKKYLKSSNDNQEKYKREINIEEFKNIIDFLLKIVNDNCEKNPIEIKKATVILDAYIASSTEQENFEYFNDCNLGQVFLWASQLNNLVGSEYIIDRKKNYTKPTKNLVFFLKSDLKEITYEIKNEEIVKIENSDKDERMDKHLEIMFFYLDLFKIELLDFSEKFDHGLKDFSFVLGKLKNKIKLIKEGKIDNNYVNSDIRLEYNSSIFRREINFKDDKNNDFLFSYDLRMDRSSFGERKMVEFFFRITEEVIKKSRV